MPVNALAPESKNALASNESMVDPLISWILKKLPASSFPTAGRTFLETIQGNKDEITEKNFTPEELSYLRNLIDSTAGRGNVQYFDYGNLARSKMKEGDARPMSTTPSLLSLGDAMGNLQTTLGRFKYSTDANGNLIVQDRYNFNPMSQNKGYAAAMTGPFGFIHNYAERVIPQGTGRNVSINLGKK